MTFFESITTVFRKYAEFGGRAGRPEFWWFTLFSTLVTNLLGALTASVDGRQFDFSLTANSFSGYVSFATVWGIIVLLPSLAVTVRRLRDAGYGWAPLLWLLLPLIGTIILIVLLAQPSSDSSELREAPASKPTTAT